MLDAIFSKSLIGPLEIAKWVFVVLFVVSTIGVIVGVYWEGEKFPKDKQHKGWLLLLVALAAETSFGMLIFLADGWISQIQGHEIIALESRLAARTLSASQITDLTEALSRFPNQHFQLFSYRYKEASDIAAQIGDAAVAAGWKRDPLASNTFLMSVLGGISINVDDQAPPAAKEAAGIIVATLKGADIDATEDHRRNANDIAVIGIAVGIKP